MRHFFALSLAITRLARGMAMASATAGLITPGGGALGVTPGTTGAGGAAIAVAAITVTAHHHLLAAAGAEEQTGTGVRGVTGAHRRLPPMRVDFFSRQADTACGPCHARLGARSRLDCGGLEAAIAPVSTAPLLYLLVRRLSPPTPAFARLPHTSNRCSRTEERTPSSRPPGSFPVCAPRCLDSTSLCCPVTVSLSPGSLAMNCAIHRLCAGIGHH